jgi:hypothetical protein
VLDTTGLLARRLLRLREGSTSSRQGGAVVAASLACFLPLLLRLDMDPLVGGVRAASAST